MISSTNKAASAVSYPIAPERRGEINNINEDHSVSSLFKSHTSEHIKRTVPQLPPELMDIIFIHVMNACSRIESAQQLIVFMNVNRDFYCRAKKLLEYPDMRAIWNDNKKFLHILEFCLRCNITPKEIEDENWSVTPKEIEDKIESFCWRSYFLKNRSQFSDEQIDFSFKYLHKKAHPEILKSIRGHFDIENILLNGQRQLERVKILEIYLADTLRDKHKALLSKSPCINNSLLPRIELLPFEQDAEFKDNLLKFDVASELKLVPHRTNPCLVM